ncbi:hypothetical protein [Bifidobacterium longum]|mgnify:CR=1 FL=1|jgi:hypothetical protein|uniref:hypothetical protein n=1 Tax=Bifidobacterium longum TaxID=216816 RepID=UPI00206FA314|nr:hypothetical protein [Bifidobacterium longum]MDF4082350.1 hypothetical protein [Bifidobacterium longum]DAU92725.1 MAG TPA: epoxidase [Caudoviricetes sp.]
MAAKIEWTAMDYAAKDALAKIIDDSALAYRVIAERMGGVVSHVRVGYIHNGEKSPVRLSEFLAICDVCNADPVQTLRDIIAEAKRIEEEQKRERRVEETKRILADNPMELAAYTDPDKEKYIEYGNGDDPA